MHWLALYYMQQPHMVEYASRGESARLWLVCKQTSEDIWTAWCLGILNVMSIQLFLHSLLLSVIFGCFSQIQRFNHSLNVITAHCTAVLITATVQCFKQIRKSHASLCKSLFIFEFHYLHFSSILSVFFFPLVPLSPLLCLTLFSIVQKSPNHI